MLDEQVLKNNTTMAQGEDEVLKCLNLANLADHNITKTKTSLQIIINVYTAFVLCNTAKNN